MQTVADLIQDLSKLDSSLPVFLASDEEWNQVRPYYAGDITPLYIDGREISPLAEEDVDEYAEDEVIKGIVLW